MRYDPDFPYNPPRRDQDRWSRLDVDVDVPSVATLLARHVPARPSAWTGTDATDAQSTPKRRNWRDRSAS